MIDKIDNDQVKDTSKIDELFMGSFCFWKVQSIFFSTKIYYCSKLWDDRTFQEVEKIIVNVRLLDQNVKMKD